MRETLIILLILACSFTVTAQTFNPQFDQGTVYHTTGEIFHGMVSWSPPSKGQYPDGDQILFKNEGSPDIFPIPYFKLRTFTMGADSFVVSSNINLKNSPILLV